MVTSNVRFIRTIGVLNVVAVALCLFCSIVWHNLSTLDADLAEYLYGVMLHSGLFLFSLSLLMQVCRNNTMWYKMVMLLFVYASFIALANRALLLPIDDNYDLAITLIFAPYLFNYAKTWKSTLRR